MSLSEPASELAINTAAPLVLLGAVLVPSADSEKRLVPSSVEYDEDKELSTIVFGEPVPAGEATLGLRWQGVLQEENMLGQSGCAYGLATQLKLQGLTKGHLV